MCWTWIQVIVLLSWFIDIYMAPEIYQDEVCDRSVDTYSFGVILYEVNFFSQISDVLAAQ